MRTGITIAILLTLTTVALPIRAADPLPKKLKLRNSAPAAETSTSVPAPEAKSLSGKTYKDPYTGMEFVFVKGGATRWG